MGVLGIIGVSLAVVAMLGAVVHYVVKVWCRHGC